MTILNALSIELNILDVTVYNNKNLLENETFDDVKTLYNITFHAVQAVSVEEKCVLPNQGYSFAIISKLMRRRRRVKESSVKKKSCIRSAV
jgi:hypothetical protein